MSNRDSAAACERPCSSAANCPITNSSARLVGIGFRLWLSGYRTGDLTHWEKAWQLYSNAMGPRPARVATSELSCWVRAVSASSTRQIEVLSDSSAGLCRDECLAVSMIAACQHKTCPAMRACAFALVENSAFDEVITQSESFASTLLGVDQIISPQFIVDAPILVEQSAQGYMQ